MTTKAGNSSVTRREFVIRAAAAGLAAASQASLSPTPARAAADLKGSGTVIVYDGGGAWGAAQRVAYFEPFEKETGIKVIVTPGAPSSKLRAGVQAGAPGYDVFDMSGGRVTTFVKEGLLEPIDYRWFDPADKAAFAPAPAHEYAVPALFYSLVVTYDPGKFGGTPPKTWADLWDTRRFPGPRSLAPGGWGPGSGTLEAALLADGVAPAQLYPLDWDRAFRSLDRIRPAITKFWQSGAESVQLVVDGHVAATSAWNGRVADIQAKGGKIAMSWEQGILQYDYWVVPKGARNVENAMKFLAFASRGRNQALFAEQIAYGPTNSRAFEFIRSERASLLPTAPELRARQVVQNYDWWSREAAPGRTNEEVAPERWEKWITSSR